MLYRILGYSLSTVLLSVSLSATADLALKNGADIDMNGSVGSTIIFSDGSILSTATGAGADGAPGADGVDGVDGAQGIQGPQGYSGVQGATGPQGLQGDTGLQGATGPQGIQGDPGSDANVPTGHGGAGNTVTGINAFVGGGLNNTASGDRSTVGGGLSNTAFGEFSTVGGGSQNMASGNSGTVSGGYSNTAAGYYASVAGGLSNSASGAYATVAGGLSNSASGNFSFAAGRRAKINAAHDGAFLFADQTNADFNSAAANEFAVRASGGVRFLTNSSPDFGVSLSGGGGTSWSTISAKEMKENYRPLDTKDILETLASLPIEQWNYKHQDDTIVHIGPYAEDFWQAFHLNGAYEGRITTQDFDGVALAAIQGLNAKLVEELANVRAEKQTEIDKLKKEFAEQFASLEQRLLAMESSIK